MKNICKSLRSEGKPLGLNFVASLFTGYGFVSVICLIIFMLESIGKPEQSQMKENEMKEKYSIGKIRMGKEIFGMVNDFVSSESASLHSLDGVALTTMNKRLELLDDLRGLAQEFLEAVNEKYDYPRTTTNMDK